MQIVPGPDTVVPGFDGDAQIRFDEPVSLPGDLRRQLVASPAYRYDVSAGFSSISVKPDGGWREGVVYCFRLPEGITDLLRNRTESPIEFCFSTGPPIADTRVEGTILERLTGRPLFGGRVLFLALPEDTVPYTAEAGREGEFSLRALPPGSYWAFGFQDRNRNLRLDRSLEPYDSARVSLEAEGASATLELVVVEPDSTPPVLATVEAVDSLTVRLLFDDHLDPEREEEAEVAVRDKASGREWPVAGVLVGEPAEVLADTAPPPGEGEPDTTGVAPTDTAEVAPPDTAPGRPPDAAPRAPPDTARRAPRDEVVPGRRPGPSQDVRLPSRAATVRLGEPLRPGVYRVIARAFANLRALEGGGDTTFVFPPGTAGEGESR